jgi:hypothetical protein
MLLCNDRHRSDDGQLINPHSVAADDIIPADDTCEFSKLIDAMFLLNNLFGLGRHDNRFLDHGFGQKVSEFEHTLVAHL